MELLPEELRTRLPPLYLQKHVHPEDVLTPELARTLVHSLTRRTGNPLFDEDLIQDVLLRGIVAFRRTASIRSPRAFLSKIARDTVCDYWRRQKPQPLSLDASIGRYALQTSWGEGDIDQARRFSQLHRALSILSSSERELIMRVYFEEQPLGRLSIELGKSRSALKMHLFRSRMKLFRLMNSQLPH